MAPSQKRTSNISCIKESQKLTSVDKTPPKDTVVSTADDAHCPQETSSSRDAFLYYSNDDVRMKKLLLKDNESDSNEEAREEQQAIPQAVERKTRISFELDPLLIMEDELLAMFDDDDGDYDSCFDLDDEIWYGLPLMYCQKDKIWTGSPYSLLCSSPQVEIYF